MTKQAKVPGGDNHDAGGEVEEKHENKADDSADDKDSKDSKSNVVSYDSHQKLLKEKKALQAKLEEMNAKDKEREEAELKKQGDLKKLLELREQELKDKSDKLSSIEAKIESSQKMNAFLKAVSGEVPEQYWGLIDLDEVVVDQETGKPDASSVAKAAKEFEAKYPDIVKKAEKRPKLPNHAANGAGVKLNYDDWLKLPDDQKAERMKDVDKSTM